MAFETLKQRLEENGFAVSVFATGQEAAAYLNGAIDGVTVGCGGSMTLKELGLYESLAAHRRITRREAQRQALEQFARLAAKEGTA